MIPRLTAAALALAAPLAVLAAFPVHFDVTCLPRETQDEARAKAKVIMDEAAAKRRAIAGVTSPDSFTQAQKTRDAKQIALNQCLVTAKRANREVAEACSRELQEMREAVARVDLIFDNTISPERPVDLDEKKALETLRAQYPACESAKRS